MVSKSAHDKDSGYLWYKSQRVADDSKWWAVNDHDFKALLKL